MDGQRFDAMARAMAGGATRRAALRLAGGVLLGGVAGLLARRAGAQEPVAEEDCPYCWEWDPDLGYCVWQDPTNGPIPCPPNGDACAEDGHCEEGRCFYPRKPDGPTDGCQGPAGACAERLCLGGQCSERAAEDGTACEGGTCCGGACVDTKTDRANCGACGSACAGTAVCAACKGSACDGLPVARCCPTGRRTNCGGKCVDLRGDERNCGRCGRRCKPNQVCKRGACVAS